MEPSAAAEFLAKCTKPALRKEWRALPYAHQKHFIYAIKCLSSLPHDPGLNPTGATPGVPPIAPNSSRYDDVVYTHMDAVDSAHFTGRFLAWHRLFLYTFETLLREECNYQGYVPYWDWTLDDYKDIKHASIWSSDPVVGLGTFPDSTEDLTVGTGAFRDLIRAYPIPHRIERNYTPRPFEIQRFPWVFDLPQKEANSTQTPAEWKKMVTSFVGNYTAFQAYVDGFRAEGVHTSTHLSIGGDVSDISHSPNDPVFFLLHGQLDRLWASWQAHDPRNARAIGGGESQDLTNFDQYPTGNGVDVTENTVVYMSNLGPDARVKDVLDTKGGYLCYEYA
ncbi:hypothetical protein BS47DRAFT_1377967 [Hydnum rufescens UP504]|uniref:Tyrosinase copper-binding domain-containing protein n=1 Tax=Hydnum rufescens UP504 TaxID=1448309 RepID=A0A9P6AJY1_9AGAM|nr:hypothetical protein BS47DRAFT_1377967 [Hydnum rufescens UP504]